MTKLHGAKGECWAIYAKWPEDVFPPGLAFWGRNPDGATGPALFETRAKARAFAAKQPNRSNLVSAKPIKVSVTVREVRRVPNAARVNRRHVSGTPLARGKP